MQSNNTKERIKKYRLLTRSNMDGIICASLLKYLEIIDNVKFVHPKDMQDGKIEIGLDDITANLPYVKGAYKAFDHHYTHTIGNIIINANHVLFTDASSTAEVIYSYYQRIGADFPLYFKDMIDALNYANQAKYTIDEIKNPTDWNLLSFIMDPRTGLGRFKEFRISNYSLMINLIDYCNNYTISEILELPDVKERVNIYHQYQQQFINQLKRCAKVEDNTVILNLKEEEIIYPGNRFMIYTLFPQADISIHLFWDKERKKSVFAVGKSIINRDSNHNIAQILSQLGGGGHLNAGTLQVKPSKDEEILEKIVFALTQNRLCKA